MPSGGAATSAGCSPTAGATATRAEFRLHRALHRLRRHARPQLGVDGNGLDFADFLLGLSQQATLNYGPGTIRFRSRAWSLFLQDDWRVNAKLTVNAGVRYEYLTPYWEANNNLVNLDANGNFTAVTPVIAGQVGPYTGAFPTSAVDADRNNIAPRTGVAWRVNSKTVVRGGYGSVTARRCTSRWLNGCLPSRRSRPPTRAWAR